MTIYKEIGEQIKSRRKSSGIPIKQIDSELAEDFGIGSHTVADWRRTVEYGIIYGTASYIARDVHGKKLLSRLSTYLEILGFDTNDPIVKEIRKIDKRFIYPLPDSETDF